MVYQINILMYVFSLVFLILLESTFLAGEYSKENILNNVQNGFSFEKDISALIQDVIL